MTNETTLPELPVAAYSNNYATYWTEAQMRAYAQQATADLSDQLFLKDASLKRLSVEMTQLRAELEQCRADADRYRYLRAEHQRIDPVCHLTWKVGMCREGSVWANTTDLDAAIDAARGAK